MRLLTGEDHIGADVPLTAQGKVCISGPIQVLNYSYFEKDFEGTFKTAVEIRN